MAPGGEMLRYHQHFGENVLHHGSHEWLPYSKNAMRTKSPNTNLSSRREMILLFYWKSSEKGRALSVFSQILPHFRLGGLHFLF